MSNTDRNTFKHKPASADVNSLSATWDFPKGAQPMPLTRLCMTESGKIDILCADRVQICAHGDGDRDI